MRRTLNMEAGRRTFATELRDLSGQRIGEVELSKPAGKGQTVISSDGKRYRVIASDFHRPTSGNYDLTLIVSGAE
jgi:hypothetical protein